MNSKNIIIILAILIAGVGVWNIITLKENRKAREEIDKLSNDIASLEAENESLLQDKQAYIENLNLRFESGLYLSDNRLNNVSINDVFNNNEKLCLYFTPLMCGPCVEEQIQKFKLLAANYGTERLCFLITLRDKESLININRRYATDIPFYHIDEAHIPFKNFGNRPVVFFTNNELTIRGCFFPESALSDVNELYYISVEEFLN